MGWLSAQIKIDLEHQYERRICNSIRNILALSETAPLTLKLNVEF